jgi:hypothetical protein
MSLMSIVLTFQANISFDQELNDNIRSLSTITASDGESITGLLYVPDISSHDACIDEINQHVPHNATRRANLPQRNYDLIALAPWLSPNCTQSFLRSARTDPIRAFIFYQPDGSSETPPVDDACWNLDDQNAWKTLNRYPVYAIDSKHGTALMEYLAAYSGNMTDVPHGHQISMLHNDPRDYVRIFTNIQTESPSVTLAIWAFVLIILATILAVIVGVTVGIQWIKRFKRNRLRRAIQDGTIDLESLGIKRLVVPRKIIQMMPVYVYTPTVEPKPLSDDQTSRGSNSSPTNGQLSPTTLSSESNTPHVLLVPLPPAHTKPPDYLHREHPFSQSACPICIEDFIPGNTLVRELPCRHVFHPECVDHFLEENSSLCPMCKKTALPRGYCPDNLTNAMVRRERMVRRMRDSPSMRERISGLATYIPLPRRQNQQRTTSSPPMTVSFAVPEVAAVSTASLSQASEDISEPDRGQTSSHLTV